MTDPADRRILFVGESFVAGVGDPTGLGWVGRVVVACHAAGRPLTAYNLGVRGDTSAQVAERWRGEARARMAATEASYGVVFGRRDPPDRAPDVAGSRRQVRLSKRRRHA